MFSLSLYNFLFISLYLAFQSLRFEGGFFAMEIFSIILYLVDAITRLLDECSNRKRRVETDDDIDPEQFKKSEATTNPYTILLNFCLDFILVIPFPMIFEIYDIPDRYTSIPLLIIQCFRLFCYKSLLWIFHSNFFKQRISLANVLTSIYLFILYNHILACIFMVIGYAQEDFRETWLSRLPAPLDGWPEIVPETLSSNSVIYLSASYWAYITTSHFGGGDITVVSFPEKIYGNIVISITVLIYAFLFGSIVSIIDDAVPRF